MSAELIDWTFPGPVVLSLDPGHRKSRFQKWWGGSSEAFRVAVEFIWASSSGAELIWFKLSSSNQPSWIRLQPLISSWLWSLAGVIWPVAANHLLKKRQSVLSWSCWVWQFFVLCFPGWCLAWQFMELIHCSTDPSLLQYSITALSTKSINHQGRNLSEYLSARPNKHQGWTFSSECWSGSCALESVPDHQLYWTDKFFWGWLCQAWSLHFFCFNQILFYTIRKRILSGIFWYWRSDFAFTCVVNHHSNGREHWNRVRNRLWSEYFPLNRKDSIHSGFKTSGIPQDDPVSRR